MTFPTNEAETISLFKLASVQLGWKIVHLQTAFPDAVIENERGHRLVIEFEFESKNFQVHGHDPTGCDLIVAYKDSWENPPVPVWALEKYTIEESKIIRQLLLERIPISKLNIAQREIKQLLSERVPISHLSIAQREIKQLRADLVNLNKYNKRVEGNSRKLRIRLNGYKTQLKTANQELALAKFTIEKHNVEVDKKTNFIIGSSIAVLIYGLALLAGYIF